jgi:hypothetical protein
MKSMPVRVTLLVLFVAASVATGYFLWTSEARLRASAAATTGVEANASTAARGVLDLRAAQQAYVATGQGEPFWIDRVSAALPDLKASIGALRAQAATPRAQTAAVTALASLGDFEQMDTRAREYARGGQRLIASDLIFSDGLEMTGAAIAALDEARAAERESHDRLARDTRRAEWLALAGYGVFGMLIVVLLLPVGRQPAAQPTPAAAVPLPLEAQVASDPLDLAIALDVDAQKWDRSRQPESPKVAPPEPVNLDVVASVCTELARVVDTRSLPSILERTAAALDATGIILWIADPDGRELTPIVAHGYSPQLLTRLGTIARDAQNATAAAFRTGLVQTVNADAVSNGAIAAPLLTPAGAVGVMAAEVKNEGEKQPARLAAATIVAAQLATLVGPPIVRAQPKAGAAGA